MKVPKARKLSSGNWFIQLRLNGESVPVTAPTEKECMRLAALVKAEYQAGKRVINDKSSYTLEQAIDYYIESRKNTLSPSTIRGYEAIKKHRLLSVMKKPLRDIDNWQALFNDEAARLSPKTVKNTYRFIKSVLKENGYTMPQIALPLGVASNRPWFDYEQIRVFIKAAENTPGELVALLALHSLRLSEILGLTKADIDLKNNIIHVSGSAVLDVNNTLVYKSTNKTLSSSRAVPIMIPRLKELLQNHEYTCDRLITCHPNTPKKQIDAVCKKAGLPLVGVHGLRHSFASLGHYLRMSPLVIANLGGWSNLQTVQKIYTHLSNAEQLKAINQMTEFYNTLKTGDE